MLLGAHVVPLVDGLMNNNKSVDVFFLALSRDAHTG